MGTAKPTSEGFRPVRKDGSAFYVVAASVAANLRQAQLQAEAIALEAMNAKVLVARAGDRALGFRPITDFMVSLAENTIRIVGEVNDEALRVSSASVAKIRSSDAVARFTHASQLAEGKVYRQSLAAGTDSVRDQDRRLEQALRSNTQRLVSLLDEINHHLRAAGIVTSTARTEVASIEPGLRDSFHTVTDKLESAASAINALVMENRRWLMRSMPT